MLFIANQIILWVITGIIPAIGFLILFFSLRMIKKRRLVDNIPTSKTSGVYMGLVELKGQAVIDHARISHLAECECVYYSWYVEEKWEKTTTESYTDSDGKRKTRTKTKSGWRRMDEGGLMPNFYLQDEEGHILIEPYGADIQALEVFKERVRRSDPLYYAKGPQHSTSDSVHVRRFVEEAIPLHHPIYVMGQSELRDDIVAPKIAKDEGAPMYLISIKSEEQISSGMKWQSIGLCILGCLIPLISVAIMLGNISPEISLETHWWVLPLVSLGFFSVWLIGWVWVVFNSMIDLKNRLQAALSNVDVQLKRRHDLIPQLVRVIEGLTQHEQEVQESLAQLRTQASATLPGQAGPSPVGIKGTVFALQEAYPELKSQGNFSYLQDQLVDCENRIALARGFYNEFASHLNTRIEVIPDTIIARLAGLQKMEYISSEGFERDVQPISL